jgi:hypothetical protein
MKPDVCCAKFLQKKKKSGKNKKSCKDCPLLSPLPKKQRKQLLKTRRADCEKKSP